MNDVHLSSITILNLLSSTIEGSYKIADSFINKIKQGTNSNPWSVYVVNKDNLASEIFENRGKPLSGLIIGVKDVIATIEFPTSMGAPSAWVNNNMGFDARVITNFKMAGAVVGGKTKTSEFAVHRETDVLNPKYPGMTAGTSSAGSAAAVANGTAKITIGTQTAGSIARPASYCGVNSFKPSFGDLPRTGVLKTSDEFDTLGIFFDQLEDISIVYKAVAVNGHNYPIQINERENSRIKYVTVLTGDPFDKATDIIQEKLVEFARSLMSGTELQFRKSVEFKNLVEIRAIHEALYKLNLGYYLNEEQASNSLSELLFEFIGNQNKDNYANSIMLRKELASWRSRFSKVANETLVITLAANTGAQERDASYDLDCNVMITASGSPQIILSSLIEDEQGKNVGVSFSSPKYSDSKLLELLKSLNLKD